MGERPPWVGETPVGGRGPSWVGEAPRGWALLELPVEWGCGGARRGLGGSAEGRIRGCTPPDGVLGRSDVFMPLCE